VGLGAGKAHAGKNDDTLRLGRGSRLRLLERPRYQRLRTKLKHKGPYMPVIIQACGEDQLAYEYRHGVTAYGAFTYALNRRLRDRARKQSITFTGLCKAVGTTLGQLGYEQRPEIDGPDAWINAAVPWLGNKAAR
jgi:metacaspase-1